MDNLFVTGSNEDESQIFKASINNEFEMSDLGNLAYFLGIENVNTGHGVFLCMKKYEKCILKKFKMIYCNPTITPKENNIKLKKESEDELVYSTL